MLCVLLLGPQQVVSSGLLESAVAENTDESRVSESNQQIKPHQFKTLV